MVGGRCRKELYMSGKDPYLDDDDDDEEEE